MRPDNFRRRRSEGNVSEETFYILNMRARLGEQSWQKNIVAQVALRRSLDKIDNNEAKSQDES